MSRKQLAFITPSYAGDHQRCLLLCESLDRMAQDDFCHYVLVADHDFALFKPLQGPRRQVIPDSALLPSWLKPFRRPFDSKQRWMWGSLTHPVWPMSGWHVQQLRKMLIARHIDQDILVMCDSDSVFVRPFGIDRFCHDKLVRLYTLENAITPAPHLRHHITWCRQAASILGLPAPWFPATDYINNMVSWSRHHALLMLDHIESLSGRDLVSTMGRWRTFSEYQIYGAFVDGVLKHEGHFADPNPLALSYWGGEALDSQSLQSFTATLQPHHCAIGIQSFTGTTTEVLRRYLEEASAR